MKEITTNQLQDQLSKVIKEVEKGEVYQIKRYSKGVAFLVSKEEFEKVVSGTECKQCVEDLRKLTQRISNS